MKSEWIITAVHRDGMYSFKTPHELATAAHSHFTGYMMREVRYTVITTALLQLCVLQDHNMCVLVKGYVEERVAVNL